jgi:hypothetical protein
MIFKTIEPTDMLESLLSDEGPFLSIFLPYGVLGSKDERMRIDRKNTIAEANRKLSKTLEDRWLRLMSEIERVSETGIRDLGHKAPPCTDIYIASETQALKTTLPNTLRPHFSFAAYAEIEPLVYFRWANEPFRIFKLELNDPNILQGVGFQIQNLKIKVPMNLAGTFGDTLDDYRFKVIVENLHSSGRNFHGNRHSEQAGTIGSSARQAEDQDASRNYWLSIVSELFKANIDLGSEVKAVVNFVLGDADLCRRFIELNPQLLIGPDQMISARYKDDNKEIMEQVLHKILEKKFALAALELGGAPYYENVNEIVELLKARQIRKLFVQQDDWFSEDYSNDGRYEFSNPRSSILADALKCRAQVVYTKSKIDNKHGLAGLSYKGSDYLWSSQKNS